MAEAAKSVSRVVTLDTTSAQFALDQLGAKMDMIDKKIADANAKGKSVAKLEEDKAKIMQRQATIQEQINKGLGSTYNQQAKYVDALRRQLNNVAIGTDEWAKKLKELKKAEQVFDSMKEKMGMVSKVQRSFMNEVKTIAMGVFIGNTIQQATAAISGYINNLLSGNAKLSDELADIEKASGLTKIQVEELNKEFRKIDTRTSSSNLRQIAIGLGQAGEEVNRFNVEKLDRIVVALGDEFGGDSREITTVLSILRNNLQDIKTNNYGDDVERIGNALNVLGASGQATAPVVVDFANRMAGVAGTFKLTSGEILGVAATFQELGINVERGSTAFIKILQRIAAEPEKFAKVSGMAVNDFIKLVNQDLMSAFVKVAEGARKAGADNVTFGKILKELDADGSGAGEVLSKVARNATMVSEKVNLATESLKNNNSITDEFNKKNNNLAANLEKIGKNIAGWFSNSSFSNLLNDFVGGLVKATGPAEDLADAFFKQQTAVGNLEKNLNPLIQRVDTLQNKSKLNKDEQVELNKAITTIASNIPSAITQFDKYGNAIGINTEKAREFIRIQKIMLQEKNREAISDQEALLKKLQAEDQLNDKRRPDIVKFTAINDPASVKGTQDFLNRATALKQRIEAVKAIIGELKGEPLVKDLNKPAGSTPPEPPEGKITQDLFGKPEDRAKKMRDARSEYEQLIKSITDLMNKAVKSDFALQFDKIIEDRKQQEAKLQDLLKRKVISKQELADGFALIEKETGSRIAKLLSDLNGQYKPEVAVDIVPEFTEQDAEDMGKVLAQGFRNLQKQKRDDLAGAELQVLLAGNPQQRLEAQKAQLDEEMFWELNNTELTENEKEVIRAKYAQKRMDLEHEFWGNMMGVAQTFFDFTSQALSGLDALYQARNSKEIAAHNAEMLRLDEKKKKVEQNLKSGVITQQEAQIQSTNIQREAAAKERELQIKQFERNKKLQTAQAVINGFQAITATLAKFGPPLPPNFLGIAAMAMTVASNVANVIGISSQKPQFRDGGIVGGNSYHGSRYGQSGIALVDRKTGQEMGEMESGEPYMILSRKFREKNAGLIPQLLQASKNGTVVPMYAARPLETIDYESVRQSISQRQFATGGIFNGSAGSAAAGSNDQLNAVLLQVSAGLSALTASNRALVEKLSQPIEGYVRLSQIEEANDTRNRILQEVA